ncbi:MAG: Sporulation initiation phosphotransferase F [candidate division BRC1 bacterium ADurb.BinA364]|nr:MAG: Sporulation initiation phosphotransferase F [candidate division BRC1 bacterium ADurb.BinA364]
MPFVTIFGAMYCEAGEVARRAAEALGCPLAPGDPIAEAAETYGASEKRIRQALRPDASLVGAMPLKLRANLVYLQAVLARRVEEGAAVHLGFGGHLIPRSISHVLRVCLVANLEYRLKRAAEIDGLAEKQARRAIHADDEERARFVQHLHGLGPWDESLYDIVAPMHERGVEETVELIAESARARVLAATAASRQAAADFRAASELAADLCRRGYDVDVEFSEGRASISLRKFTFLLERAKEKIEEAAREFPNVQQVEVGVGPEFYAASSPYARDVALPPRLLLVDDERDFALTLSERLLLRDLESAVVYDGEQALRRVRDEEPDVIVLDLKMPGIDGMSVLESLKQSHPRIEVIILTGHGSPEDEEEARRLGAFAFLRKPIDIEELTGAVRSAYEKIQRQREGRASAPSP